MTLLSNNDSIYLKDILNQIGDKLLVDINTMDSIYEEEPVDIETFINSQEYLNASKYTYDVVKKDLKKIFEGNYTEVVCLEGIGCHPFNTKVIMLDGSFKNVEDIKIGDMLLGPDSNPRKVLSLINGYGNIYKIIPTKGDIWYCNEDHILHLVSTNTDKNIPKQLNISVRDYVKKSKTFKEVWYKQTRTKLLDFSSKNVTIDPYFLGLMLGDGSTTCGIRITTMDNHIYTYVKNYVSSLGLNCKFYNRKGKASTYGFVKTSSVKNILQDMFINYKLIVSCENKFIPDDYKVNSKEIRLQILAGLIDSDGSLQNNCFEITFKSKQLAKDVSFVCRSLGLRATMIEVHKKCYNNGKIGSYYRVHISGDTSIIPTKLSRKQATKRKQKKNPLVDGFKIEYVRKDSYYGFKLNKDNLYLLEDFTVTHNSGKSHKAAVAIAYMVYRTLCLRNPQEYYHLSPDSKIAFMNMSTSAAQAKKIVFGKISSMIQNCAWFKKKGYLPNPKKTSELELPKGIYIIPGSSSETAPLGFDILGAVLDEAAFMIDTKTSGKKSAELGDHNVAEEIYNALQRRIESRFLNRGLILVISSPRYKGDFISIKYEEAKINDNIYAVRRATFDCKPVDFYCGKRFIIDIKNKLILKDGSIIVETDDKERFYKNDYNLLTIPWEYLKSSQRNLIKFMRDICAIASRAITPYILNYKYWEEIGKNSILKHPFENGKFADWFKGNGEAAAVHVDLGTGKPGNDACGIAMAIVNSEDKSKYKIPFMESLRAIDGEELDFGYVRDIIIALRNLGFDIKYVTYDGWQSIDSRQQLEKKGFKTEYLSVDKDLAAYDTLKEITNEGKVDYYGHPIFLEELEGLELIEGKKVDHPPKGSKDISDAVAGAIYKLVSNPPEEVEIWFGDLR